jgi:predicted pyridoxine 5'-phosphate oxidase superfamily flavin-nucleotide-binding protein
VAYAFGSLVFTPVIKALQEQYGSRRQYAKKENSSFSPDSIGPSESQFLAEADSLYMSSVGATGWPYVQHRGGPKGFLKIIDERTVAFADFRGNKQYISAGNLATDDRIALIVVDYPRQVRLKILGRAEVLEGNDAKEWVGKLHDPGYEAVIERVYVIHVEASDWNCSQHINPRFTGEQIRLALAPVEKELQVLRQENERLQAELIQVRDSERRTWLQSNLPASNPTFTVPKPDTATLGSQLYGSQTVALSCPDGMIIETFNQCHASSIYIQSEVAVVQLTVPKQSDDP